MDRRAFLATLPLLLGACSPAHRLTVGSKNFTEQLILGEMLAQLIASVTREPVDRRLYLAGTYICHQALLAGRIDLYVEYTGTALAAVLKQRATGDHRQVYEEVKDEYLRRFGLQVFPPLGFDNSFAIVMRGDDAARMKITKLSQLAPFSPKLRMGVGYEFLERRDGYDGLVSAYGLRFAATPRVMDLGLLYRALENRQVDLIAGANTDGLIAALHLAVLADDRRYFPPYDAVPIVRDDTLQRHPAVRSALDRLTGRISVDDMRSMNYAVDGEKRDAAQVAHEFLVGCGLISK
jgi:osmoprotectant transport system substrate-binding protein